MTYYTALDEGTRDLLAHLMVAPDYSPPHIQGKLKVETLPVFHLDTLVDLTILSI